MISGKKTVALIPARAGSKRLPGKNTKILAGKPLIGWTIEAAKKSENIDIIVVSSDDDDVLSIARGYGCVALERPGFLATDTATTVEVVEHALAELKAQSVDVGRLALLQPTSPLRAPEDIDKAISLMDEKKASSIISVCETEHSPLWCNKLPSNGSMDDFISDDLKTTRSQDLPRYYRINGAIYLADTSEFSCEKGFYMANSYAFVMPKERSIDIDEALDFALAECILVDKIN